MTERKDLSSRILPQMVLSDTRNPLTAPLQLSGSTSSERACQRFAIEGNAIVTGGSGVLGLAACRALLEHGASGVSIFDVLASISSGKEAITRLQEDFPRAKIITKIVDVRDDATVNAAVSETAVELGSVNILLCFAGVVGTTHATDMDVAEWKRVLDINTTGSWICAQAVAKCMINQKTGGSILFTASISGHSVNFPQPQVSYNVSKGAIVQLRRSLAAEWAQYGIRVNSISPGYMDTVLNEGEGLAEGRRIWCERNPMGRMGAPEELTGAIVLLCSKYAGRYITGADILVDGGQTVF
ncbi:NAD(P)-binding protein [Armillaria gallica]|uniref:D-arabinitol 2-dehydrogenase [ribulose-forming] n=1 Tax=Armillaria gallica TaxID=47427 RepID=A0A2H3D7X3_ARMGA|nr:NAD(P)-binding protein [Armillaria gallica]